MTPNSLPISVDGVLHAPGEARLRADNAGFAHGVAVFDTLLCERGRLVWLEPHMQRLAAGCLALEIDAPLPAALARAVEEYARQLPPQVLAVRTTVARNAGEAAATVVIAARTFEPAPADGITLVVERRFALAGDALDSIKTTNRARHVAATLAARRAGAFDAVFLHSSGDAVCAANANLWAVVDERLTTPPLARGALRGIVRGLLVAQAQLEVREAPLALADLSRASEIFLTNSLHGAIPVLEITGVRAGLPGPRGVWERRVRELLAALPR
ncbi:MAG: aminotransferase class IV [Planctomycetes bacterium]|nr:aminotransferase class IV [Planctomycetota bacterium]